MLEKQLLTIVAVIKKMQLKLKKNNISIEELTKLVESLKEYDNTDNEQMFGELVKTTNALKALIDDNREELYLTSVSYQDKLKELSTSLELSLNGIKDGLKDFITIDNINKLENDIDKKIKGIKIEPQKEIEIGKVYTLDPGEEAKVEVTKTKDSYKLDFYIPRGVSGRGMPGKGVASGGTTNQVLAKNSNDDYDTKWVTGGSGGTSDHSELTNLDYASAGHTGFQPAGDYALSSDIPTKTSELTNDSGFITTPYTLPTASTTVKGGVKVDGTTITITDEVISAVTGGSGDVTGPASSTDNNIVVFNGLTGKIIKDGGVTIANLPNDKVKYDAGDTSAGYVADKVIAGTGISVAEGTAGNENKLVVTNSAPDQTVAITAGTNITSVTGTYPNFTINAATQTTDLSGQLHLDQTTPQSIINGIPLLTADLGDFTSSSQLVNKEYADTKIAKATNVTAINDTGIADGEIAVFNLTNKDIRTSDKTIVTSLGADDTTLPTSKAVKDVTDGKQATLVSGTNIKTINSTTLLGSGDLTISEFTDEKAQDAVGTILTDTATIDFTYTDATPSITADVKDASISLAKMANLAKNTIIGRVTASTGVPEALTAANVRTIINVADGATANTKATGDEIDTGTDDVKFATAKAIADSKLSYTDGTETLTNKTLTTPKINEAVNLTATSTELNILDGATLTTTELNYVDGVTSAIQTQLNGKVSTTNQVKIFTSPGGSTTTFTVSESIYNFTGVWVKMAGFNTLLFSPINKVDGSTPGNSIRCSGNQSANNSIYMVGAVFTVNSSTSLTLTYSNYVALNITNGSRVESGTSSEVEYMVGIK